MKTIKEQIKALEREQLNYAQSDEFIKDPIGKKDRIIKLGHKINKLKKLLGIEIKQ